MEYLFQLSSFRHMELEARGGDADFPPSRREPGQLGLWGQVLISELCLDFFLQR